MALIFYRPLFEPFFVCVNWFEMFGPHSSWVSVLLRERTRPGLLLSVSAITSSSHLKSETVLKVSEVGYCLDDLAYQSTHLDSLIP